MSNDSAPRSPKRKKKRSKIKTLHIASEPDIEKEPIENPNNVSISDAKTKDGEEHESSQDNDSANNDDNDAPPSDDNEPEKGIEIEPEVELDDPPPRNKRYDKRDYVARKHGRER